MRNAVWVGRPSVWGNPYSHREDSQALYHVETRDVAVSLHAQWILSSPDWCARARSELAGRDLACVCAPVPCHARVLRFVANAGGNVYVLIEIRGKHYVHGPFAPDRVEVEARDIGSYEGIRVLRVGTREEVAEAAALDALWV